jgi:hypothetical protein
MLPLIRSSLFALLALAVLPGCFVEAGVKQACQRSPPFSFEGASGLAAEPLSLSEHVDFAVPVTLSEKLSADVTLQRLMVRETSGVGTVDFLSQVDVEVQPVDGSEGPVLSATLAPQEDGAFGFEGALDVTPVLTGETFRYTIAAEGTIPSGPRTVDVEACVTARLWLSLP